MSRLDKTYKVVAIVLSHGLAFYIGWNIVDWLKVAFNG